MKPKTLEEVIKIHRHDKEFEDILRQWILEQLPKKMDIKEAVDLPSSIEVSTHNKVIEQIKQSLGE